MNRSRRLHVGTIAGAHGVRGLVRLRVHADDPFLCDGALHTAPEGARALTVALKSPHGRGGYLALVEGVGTRQGAQELAGTRLYCDRAALPEAGPGEYYYADLAGLAAQDGGGVQVGKVLAVHDFGAGDLLEIAPEEGESFLLPFTDPYVLGVDIAAGRVTIAQWEAFQ